jgi:tripartite-type tricarboxylate transporter receptor subunit TctC
MMTRAVNISGLAAWAVFVALVSGACAPSAPAPTAAPSKPPAASAPAASPASAPAAASPAASPGASPAAKPAASPAAAAAAPAADPAVADFYRGKTVKIIVGYAPGGLYDIFSRLAAKHLPKFLPGSPTVVVENRPGAGSLLAAGSLYNTEPKDGTALGVFSESSALQEALGGPGIQFESTKFNWIGSPLKTNALCMVRKDTGITDIRQLMSGREVIAVATGKGSLDYNGPSVMNLTLGTNFKLVTGYSSGPETQTALEKGEGQLLCTGVDVLLARQLRLVEGPDAIANLLVHGGVDSPDMNHPLLRPVPSMLDLAPNEEARIVIQAMNAPLRMSRPVAAPPGVPAARVAALRRALQATYADPAFIEVARQAAPTYSVEGTTTGEEMDKLVQELFSLPPAVVQKLKILL